MMSERPDPTLLDELVSGFEPEEAEGAWAWLVRSPDGLEAWEQATARRRALDRLAALVQGHPWLARPLRAVRRWRARASEMPPLAELVTASPAPAMLGPTERGEDITVFIRCGEVQSLPVNIGVVVRVERAVDLGMTVWFRYSRGEGRLGGVWEMEAGDAPVLLVACQGSEDATTLDAALAAASAVGGVMLLEAPTAADDD